MPSDKYRILFVDDEANVLNGLRRTLRNCINEWEMVFAQSGPEALELLKKSPFDVIVSDMRMPEMSGLELLQIVQQKYPQMVRIILSGHSDQEYLLKSTATTHQFLSKPCEVELLRNAITSSTRLKRLLKDPQLMKMATQMKSLPSLPPVYKEIQRALQTPNVSLGLIGTIVEKDPGMSAKVLQLVNSSFFGVAKHVSSPSQAVMLLGMEITRSLVLSIHLFEQLRDEAYLPNLINPIWNHSTSVSGMAKKIARLLNLDNFTADFAFIAGLLHDIGKTFFIAEAPRTYLEIVSKARSENLRIYDLEQKTFRTTHAELGAYMLGLWGFRDPVIEAVAYHHLPTSSGSSVKNALTALHIANTLDNDLNPEFLFGRAQEFDVEYLKRTGVWSSIDSIRKSIRHK